MENTVIGQLDLEFFTQCGVDLEESASALTQGVSGRGHEGSFFKRHF